MARNVPKDIVRFSVFVWGARALAHMHMREHMGERAVTTDQKPDYSGLCLESAQYLVAGMFCCSLSGTKVHFAQQPATRDSGTEGWVVCESQPRSGPIALFGCDTWEEGDEAASCSPETSPDLLPCELVSKDAGL